MKITCEFCGTEYDDTLEKCPSCSAENKNVRKQTKENPTTIEELAEWYRAKNLPPYETTRFFIGQDVKQPRAFGIYKNETTGNVTVYKNKDNGQRAVRYEGTDEAFAVNEIFTKLKEQIILQKQGNIQNNQRSSTPAPSPSTSAPSPSTLTRCQTTQGSKKKRSFPTVIVVLLVAIFVLPCLVTCFVEVTKELLSPQEGYYKYNNGYYYHWVSDENYYKYDSNLCDWVYCEDGESVPPSVRGKAQKYFVSIDYNDDPAYIDFADSKRIAASIIRCRKVIMT